jgi:hypothetical protein
MNRALAAMFLALFVSGCPKRVEPGPETPLTRAAEVLERVRGAQGRVGRLTGEAKLTVDSPQARGTVGLFVAVSRPGRVRVELFDFFNRPQGLLVVSEGRFGFYSPQENQYLTGPASPANVSRFLPLALPLEELVSVLLGEAPLLGTGEGAELAYDPAVPAYALRLRAGPAEQTLRVHPRHFRVLRSEVSGVAAYDLGFEDFLEREGAAAFPRHLTVASQAAQARLELRYTELALDPPEDPALFLLEPPEGVPVVEVDARGAPVPRGS